ncbi:MAG: amino acid-binding ACT domain-containing protein [Candidatus Heimdallarchaeota archaeon]|nr:amino acid-binding ACT domain-containing protein [Candidatus Heimdallarchaeota archaeon]
MKDLTVILQNRPGTIADMSEALGKAGVNIEGMCGFPCEGEGVIHLLVENAAIARTTLESAGFEIRGERDILVWDLGSMVGKPGSGGDLTRKIANAGINLDLIYFAENNRLILGVDDLEKTKSVLG